MPVSDHSVFLERCGFVVQELATKCMAMPSPECIGPFLNVLLEYNTRFPGAFWATWGESTTGILNLAINVVAYPQRDVRRSGLQFLAQAISTIPQGAAVPQCEAIVEVCFKVPPLL